MGEKESGTDSISVARCETSGDEMNEPHPSGEAFDIFLLPKDEIEKYIAGIIARNLL